jgi:hypothetical protein
MIHPFWRWFEGVTGIESYGHSGPAEWCYWFVYSIIVVTAIYALLKIRSHTRKRKAAG